MLGEMPFLPSSAVASVQFYRDSLSRLSNACVCWFCATAARIDPVAAGRAREKWESRRAIFTGNGNSSNVLQRRSQLTVSDAATRIVDIAREIRRTSELLKGQDKCTHYNRSPRAHSTNIC